MTLAFLSLPPANVPFVCDLVKQPSPSPSCLLEPCRLGIEDFCLPTTSHLSHRTHSQATLPSVDYTLALYFTKRRSYALLYISPSLGELVLTLEAIFAAAIPSLSLTLASYPTQPLHRSAVG